MSFGAIHSDGSKFLTSPAIRVGNAEASKWVIGPIPERPLTMPSQLLSRPFPTGDRMPIPVTTTRRLDMSALLTLVLVRLYKCTGPRMRPRRSTTREGLRLDVCFDVIDRLLHRGDLLGFL